MEAALPDDVQRESDELLALLRAYAIMQRLEETPSEVSEEDKVFLQNYVSTMPKRSAEEERELEKYFCEVKK